MYQLINIFKKQKLFILISTVVFLIIVGSWFNSRKVSAQFLPVVVNVNHLDFGTVFPGETLGGNFTVTYIDEVGEVNYRIVQQRKPLLEAHPDYPDGGDPAMPGYYRDLCPFLEKISVEQEGDTEDLAWIGINDISDVWIINFKVPAIFGQVGQDHVGGVVDSNGEYGCEVSIDLLE